MSITLRPLTPELWPALEAVLAPDGVEGCWCLNHRVPADGVAPTGEPARCEMERRVRADTVRGVLAFVGDRPAGWCAVDPREEIPGHDVTHAGCERGIWSIHCLWVRPDHRGRGIARALVIAAVELARRAGALGVEAYPAEEGRGLDFTGPAHLYTELGFAVQPAVVGPFGRATLKLAQAMPAPDRSEIRIGMRVRIVEKHNQRSGTLTEGVVARILTKSATHPHGIKVMLETGEVGRVKSIVG